MTLQLRAAVVPAFVALLAGVAGCQIDEADVPKFGGPCSNGCANGFRCDRDLDACVPEDEPTDAGSLDGGSPDGGNPEVVTLTIETPTQPAGDSVNVEVDEEFTLSWETRDVTACSISPPVGAVAPNASTSLSLAVVGAKEFVLTCTGNGAPLSSAPVFANVGSVLDGDLIVLSNTDLDAALNVTEVTGDVIIDGASLTGVAQLATLQTVGGDFRFTNTTGVGALTLPALRDVGGSLLVMDADTQLESFSAPALLAVGEDVRFEDCPALESISAPQLAVIDRDLYLGAYEYPSFPDVWDFDTCAGLFSARPVPALTTVNLPGLTTIGRDFDVEDCVALRSLSLPALTSIGGMLAVFQLGEFTSGKSTLDLPALTTVSTLEIAFNRNLGTVNLGALETTVRLPAAEAQDPFGPLTEVLPSPLFHIYRAVQLGYCSTLPYLSTGDLVVVDNGIDANEVIETLDLSSLTYLAGGLTWYATSEATQAFPLLESAEGIDLAYGGTTATISFEALAEIRQYGLRLYELPATSIRFPLLTDLTGNVELNPGAQVTEFELPVAVIDSLDLDEASPAVVNGLSLTAITGGFEISALYEGNTLGDLSSLTSIGENLDIYAPNVQDLTGLEGLVSVGDNLRLSGGIRNTSGLESLTTVGYISCSNENLESLSLPALTTVTEPIYGIDCDSSPAFPGNLTEVLLPSLASLPGPLRITYSPVASIDIGQITTLGGLSIGGTAMTNLDAFCGLTASTEHLAIYQNSALVDISGLQNLTTIDSFLFAIGARPEIQCQIASIVEQTGVVPDPGDIDFTLPAPCGFNQGVCP